MYHEGLKLDNQITYPNFKHQERVPLSEDSKTRKQQLQVLVLSHLISSHHESASPPNLTEAVNPAKAVNPTEAANLSKAVNPTKESNPAKVINR